MLNLPTVRIEPTPVYWKLRCRFTSPFEVESIVTLLTGINAQRVMEIGCNEGLTSKAILENVPSITEYFGVDVLQGYRFACSVQEGETSDCPGKYVLDDLRFNLIVSERGSFDLDPEDFGGPLDAVFIDGDHSNLAVEHDSMLAFRVVRSGGLVIWHDYHDLGKVGVKEVLEEHAKIGRDIKHVEGTWLAYRVMP
jgi:predicted O-methyltransferase YrrM